MATSQQVAQAFHRQQQQISAAATRSVVQQFSQLDEHALSESWSAGIGRSITATVSQAQLTAASGAAPYLADLAEAQGAAGQVAAAVLIPQALSGIASDGRPLFSLLYLPILLIKSLLSRGAKLPDAMRQGRTMLALLTSTQVADAGRAAVTVGMTGDRGWVSYVRFLKLPSCGRCIVLAGREYSWSTGFPRHPQCDCYHLPIRRDSPERLLVQSPAEAFAAMTPEEQDKAFTKAGAEAVRLGADIGQVVNARRGMQTAMGGRLVTTEGTTSRGIAGKQLGNLKKQRGERYRRSQTVRPMPEQLIKDAGGDRELAVQFLRRFAYLMG
ncbi:hypothetical protein IMZ11_02365 [Microtetraspora sp. AC03309]|uniref:VG15 protein n=1 Tax=Microtetraspora sp. AC03309 TaxID=2779376 RepID=UPI001E3857AB|nr:hypothetical protein [Microtetraspora sp. AC03309]MCC5574485.1 hypothetical protein [Microtetraspora sp. AC03309]